VGGLSVKRAAVIAAAAVLLVGGSLAALIPLLSSDRPPAPDEPPLAVPAAAAATPAPVPLTFTDESKLHFDPKLEEAPGGEGSKFKLLDVALPTTLGEGDLSKIQLLPSGGGEGERQLDLTWGRTGGALGGSANFMGTPARGQRFCIIADRSGSMSGAKMEYVKAEVIKTVNDLRGKFYIVFFDSVADPMPINDWLTGRKDVPRIAPWVQSIFGRGGTRPSPGFQVAMGLNPRPDVIFLMTDGGFSPREADLIDQMNTPVRGKKTVIHTIAFVDRGGEALLQKIANQSGGTYRYVAGFHP
jgi:hypothetical protein